MRSTTWRGSIPQRSASSEIDAPAAYSAAIMLFTTPAKPHPSTPDARAPGLLHVRRGRRSRCCTCSHRPVLPGSRGGFGVFACARVALNTASKIGVGSPSSRFGRSSPGLRFSSPTRPVSATTTDSAGTFAENRPAGGSPARRFFCHSAAEKRFPAAHFRRWREYPAPAVDCTGHESSRLPPPRRTRGALAGGAARPGPGPRRGPRAGRGVRGQSHGLEGPQRPARRARRRGPRDSAQPGRCRRRRRGRPGRHRLRARRPRVADHRRRVRARVRYRAGVHGAAGLEAGPAARRGRFRRGCRARHSRADRTGR